MTVEGIEVVADVSNQQGGHAIIRLKGLWLLPASATFRIEPIEEFADSDDMAGWPVGDLKPRDTRMTATGIEILIGPEVVDQPELVPGTPVRLSIPAAAVDTEIRWPDLPLSRQAGRGPLVMTPVKMTVASRPLPAASPGAVTGATAATVASAAGMGPAASQRPNAASASPPAASASTDVAALAQLQPRASAARATGLAGAEVGMADPAGRTDGQSLAQAANRLASANLARTPGASSPPATPDKPAATKPPAPATPDGPKAPPADIAAAAAPGARREPLAAEPGPRQDAKRPAGSQQQPDRATQGPGPTASAAAVGSAPAVVAATGPARGQRVVPVARDRRERSLGFLLWPLVTGLAVSAGLTALVWPRLSADLQTRPQTIVAQPLPAAQVTPPVAPPAQAPPFDVSAIFTAGDTSPQGIPATGKDVEAVLTIANRSLHGIGGPPDRDEAAFWLRKALSLTLTEQHLKWAMTQLGTVYAQPRDGRTPDYHSARLLWEISGAMGDPVALCFVGQLHEYGLGGLGADKGKARAAYLKAQELGGCKGIDAALARVRE